MASKALSPSVKPQTFKVLQKIDGQFCYEEVLVRLLHFWKVRNFKRGNALIGVESLLHDSEVWVYWLWRERNGRRHGEAPTPPSRMKQLLDKQIHNRFSSIRTLGDRRYEHDGEIEFAERFCQFVIQNHRELMLVVPKMDVSYDMKSKMEVMLHHTKANVAVGEELTYDYLFGPDEPHECKVPCLCKFASCMKF